MANIEILITEILSEYESSISVRDYNSINNYIEHGEWGIAFELLCTVLEQDAITISSANYEKIAKLGIYFEYDSILWNHIQVTDS